MDDGVRVERVEGEGWLVSIRGEHDLTTAPMLSQAFEPLFASGAFVVADIREVTFLDSQTLGVFASAIERAAAHAATDPVSGSRWSSTSNRATRGGCSKSPGRSSAMCPPIRLATPRWKPCATDTCRRRDTADVSAVTSRGTQSLDGINAA